jgi:predicted ribosomally synthesized peptide with nif11-like leader
MPPGGLLSPVNSRTLEGVTISREDQTMSSDELKSFLQSICTKPELLEELRSLLQAPDAAIRWARERGYHLTPADVAEIQQLDQELSDDELDQVAGGDTAWPLPPLPLGDG